MFWLLIVNLVCVPADPTAESFLPLKWEYSAPLVAPELREHAPSHAQKDPTIVYHKGKWHLFMTVKLENRSAIEYCSFADWDDANSAERHILEVSTSDYFCAPQVFYFEPHAKWYLVYQVGVPGQRFMQVAYSTTNDVADPHSWSAAQPMLDGGTSDPRSVGGLDYWIICDKQRAYLFFTSLNGKMWRMWTELEVFPQGFDHCQVALEADIFEASHTYRLKDQQRFITIVEEDQGKRFYKAFVAEQLDGEWREILNTEQTEFASWRNVQPMKGVSPWTDNISHGELIRDSIDQTMTIDPKHLRFVFQGITQTEKAAKSYGQFRWRIGLLTPVPNPATRPKLETDTLRKDSR